MKGNDRVLEILNQVLTNELTAINQYFVHAKMCENWGYLALSAKIRAESIDEMRHADQLISRILYLDGVPNLQRLSKVRVGESVPEQLKLDLDTEIEAIAYLNKGIGVCQEVSDHGSRELLSQILVSEELHADWLEEQVGLIEKIGEANYLTQQLRP